MVWLTKLLSQCNAQEIDQGSNGGLGWPVETWTELDSAG